jgi:hypothetical protein
VLTPAKLERIHSVIRAQGMKGEFAKTAKRLMRETPEYAQARTDGRAREWLEREAQSFAAAAYELLLQRLEDLDP